MRGGLQASKKKPHPLIPEIWRPDAFIIEHCAEIEQSLIHPAALSPVRVVLVAFTFSALLQDASKQILNLKKLSQGLDALEKEIVISAVTVLHIENDGTSGCINLVEVE